MPANNLAEVFLRSARAHAGRPALRVDGRTYTYAELAARARGLAAALLRAAPDGHSRCGLLVDKSFTGYAALLGILLAGRTYVPLHPRFPAARNAAIVARADIDVLIVDAAARDAAAMLLPACSAPLRVLFADGEPTSQQPGVHTLVAAAPVAVGEVDTPPPPPPEFAYLMFTSGSTGAPKGVGISHTNVCAYIEALGRQLDLGSEDRCSQFFDFTFDLSVHDLFVTWAAGACLVTPSRTDLLMPQRFVQQHALTVWFSVPSLAIHLRRLALLRPATLPSLRWALFCGEALPTAVASEFQAAAMHAKLLNLYGPTEATIAFTAFAIDPAAADGELGAVVPLGRPLAGQEVVVVDASLHPVPDGTVGELCLGGDQVASGYWQDPATTASRFVALDVPGRRSRRWYRTGDLARWDDAVGLRFHGRVDRQVKVRGYRVELQEVEEAVRVAAGVDAVAVIPWLRGADGGTQGLVAFIVGTAAAAGVRAACGRVLPEYMIPTEIHGLAELPLNPNGKVDYAQLQRIREAMG